MTRFLTLALILAASVASALFLRDFLTGSDLNGVTLLPLGVASLNLQYTINTGVNFGLAGEATAARQLLLSGAALLICLAIIVWGLRSKMKWAAPAAGLFAGGGLANAYERLAFGGVFDYLNFSTSFFDNPFSFNLADIYIFLGLVLFLLAPRETHDPADGPISAWRRQGTRENSRKFWADTRPPRLLPLRILAGPVAGELPLRPDI